MRGVYVTYVADADNKQWHVVPLVWSLKLSVCSISILCKQHAPLFLLYKAWLTGMAPDDYDEDRHISITPVENTPTYK